MWYAFKIDHAQPILVMYVSFSSRCMNDVRVRWHFTVRGNPIICLTKQLDILFSQAVPLLFSYQMKELHSYISPCMQALQSICHAGV